MLSNGFHAVPAGKVAVVVTHLEMRAAAPVTRRPLPAGLTLRKIDADLTWYRDVFTRVGATNWLWSGRLKLSDIDLSAIIHDPKVDFFTLTKDGQDEALLELDYRIDGACEVAYFGLTQALIGTGAGRCLMNEAITQAWSKPIARFHLRTCTIDSPQALDFYRRSGFVTTKQEIEIDDDPRVTGILPRTAGPNVPIFDP